MFKRTLCVLLSCCLMLLMLAVSITAEGGTASATDTSGYRGDNVSIIVSLADCDPSDTIGIILDYDKTALKFLGIDYSEWLVDGILSAFDDNMNTGVLAYESQFNVNTDICKLVFAINDDAAIEETEIECLATIKTGSTVNAEISATATVDVLCNHVGGYDNDFDKDCGICGETRVLCTPTMTVSGDSKADRADKIELTVNVADCIVNGKTTVVNTLGLTYQYDKTVLELVEDECEWLVESSLSSFDGSNSTAALISEADFDANTNLCKLVFKVLDEAALGNTSVNCSLKIMNGPHTLAVPTANATVRVTNVHTYDDVYDLDCNDEGCVHDRAITGFTISKTPTKLEYRKNSEVLDVTGGMLLIAYDDGTTEEIAMLLEHVSGFDNTVLGTQTLTVTVAGYTQTFEVEITVIRGDVNGDEEVNGQDAIQVLRYTIYPSFYQVNQDCDFNGDGEVNAADAIRLLYHTLYPSLYPLS